MFIGFADLDAHLRAMVTTPTHWSVSAPRRFLLRRPWAVASMTVLSKA